MRLLMPLPTHRMMKRTARSDTTMTPAHFKARTKPFVILRIVFTAHPPPLSWPLQQKYLFILDYLRL
jgi:hypothetical protein